MLKELLASGASEQLGGFAAGWGSTPERLAVALGVTLTFALFGRAVRGVTAGGAVAGGLVSLALFAAAGPTAFAALVALFTVTWLATRAGYRGKQEFGLAERREGRDAGQVLANLGAAGVCAAAFVGAGNKAWLVAMVAALAEAATDTVASEIGQTRLRGAWLITTWERVAAGTDGGITVTGTLAGAVAGTLIAAVAAAGGLLPLEKVWIPAAAGFLGMAADSLLGATVQRQGWIDNKGVNLLSTAGAAAFAFGLSRLTDAFP